MPRQQLKIKFLEDIGLAGYEFTPIPADASFRTYDRIQANGISYILMNSPLEHYDTKPFIDIAKLLKSHSLPAPEIYNIDSENGFLLLEDFGEISVKNYLNQNPHNQHETYKGIVELLVKVQEVPANHLPLHSVEDMLKGAEVFIEWYVPFKTGKNMNQGARDEFLANWREMLSSLPETKLLALRDFHVENLMYMDDGIGLLDFQDATQSHPAYDLVSLLEDARYDMPNSIAQDMIKYYLSLNPKMDKDEFIKAYEILGAQRNCRILGVFARKAMRDGAKQYLDLIPRVLNYLRSNKMSYLLKDYIS